jgi:hypothetical protein
MVKNNRLDLRLQEKDKENLIAIAKAHGCTITELIEALANHKFIFIDEKIAKIFKLYGYSLNIPKS